MGSSARIAVSAALATPVAIALFLSPRSAKAMTTLAYSKTQIEQREPAKPALISIFFFLPLTGAPAITPRLYLTHGVSLSCSIMLC